MTTQNTKSSRTGTRLWLLIAGGLLAVALAVLAATTRAAKGGPWWAPVVDALLCGGAVGLTVWASQGEPSRAGSTSRWRTAGPIALGLVALSLVLNIMVAG